MNSIRDELGPLRGRRKKRRELLHDGHDEKLGYLVLLAALETAASLTFPAGSTTAFLGPCDLRPQEERQKGCWEDANL